MKNMDNQSWPPAPQTPQPKAAGISPSRALMPLKWMDAVLGSVGGFITGIGLFVSISLAGDHVVPPPETYPKMVVVWAIATGLSAIVGFILWRCWPILGVWAAAAAELPLLLLLLLMSLLHGL